MRLLFPSLLALLLACDLYGGIWESWRSWSISPRAVYPEHIGIDHKEENVTDNGKWNILVRHLQNALGRYERIEAAGGWPKITSLEGSLREGDIHPVVPRIKKRLYITGDFPKAPDTNMTFGPSLAEAVERFQWRHGLKIDGIVGPRTLCAMNVDVAQRIRTIKINIIRLEWLTQPKKDFLVANIPAFTITLYRNETPVLSMKTIVGKKSRPTPMLSDRLTYSILNPCWRAPKTIVAEDILPKLKAGRFDYLQEKGIIATRTNDGNDSIDLKSIDWSRYNEDNIPFIFMQKSGPKNYLGFVKFMFPNPFDIYIHDTPEEDLFSKRYRARSSGCIRVERPLELFHALYDPQNSGKWSYKKIASALLGKKEKLVGLPGGIPVYILYMTVFTDKDGIVHFAPDIYGYDAIMARYINRYQQKMILHPVVLK
ncbi:L,D-transpeptidase family protein [Hydrogenimonas sp.]